MCTIEIEINSRNENLQLIKFRFQLLQVMQNDFKLKAVVIVDSVI